MTNLRPRPRLAAAGVVLLLGLAIAGCSANDDDAVSDDDSGSTAAQSGADAGGDALAMADESGDVAQSEAAPARADRKAGDGAGLDPTDGRALVRKGTVSLRADDVDAVRFDVTTIVAENGGEVSQDETEADRDGDAQRTRLTMRVPESSFQVVMEALEQVEGSERISATTTTEDVTTEVIDVDVRVRLQQRSIDRISLLLERAQNIRDIVNIESELARREADLGSLQQRQAFLADQTAMATIEVAIQRPATTPAPPPEKDDDDGFLAGLADGWEAFQSVTTGLLTGTGAVLPFAAVALVIGLPAWVLVRRRRQPGTAAPVTSPAQSG